MVLHVYPENVTGFVSTIQYVNTVTDKMFAVFALCLIFFVTFMALKRYTTEAALASSAALTTVIAFLFLAMDLIAPHYMIIYLVLVGIGGAMLYRYHHSKDGTERD